MTGLDPGLDDAAQRGDGEDHRARDEHDQEVAQGLGAPGEAEPYRAVEEPDPEAEPQSAVEGDHRRQHRGGEAEP